MKTTKEWAPHTSQQAYNNTHNRRVLPGPVAVPSCFGCTTGTQTCIGGPPAIVRPGCWLDFDGPTSCGFTIAYNGPWWGNPPPDEPVGRGAKRRGTRLPRISGPCGCGGAPPTTTGTPGALPKPPLLPPTPPPPLLVTICGCSCCCCCCCCG